ncbi:MAG: DUF4260 domain-containing protein [Flavobacteriales bacterium]|nr:DUF4260 domain-containing protein [Flavobacteriales bacterium]
MKNLIRIEELAQFVLIALGLFAAHLPWWVFVLMLLAPDVGILGYLVNPRFGAFCYNLLHHKGVAIACVILGQLARFSSAYDAAIGDWDEVLLFTGVILYGHASMDRIFGYGLKFGDSFHHTHLGWIGGRREQNP